MLKVAFLPLSAFGAITVGDSGVEGGKDVKENHAIFCVGKHTLLSRKQTRILGIPPPNSYNSPLLAILSPLGPCSKFLSQTDSVV